MNWRKSWVAWPLVNYKITALVCVVLFLLGIYSLVVMPKDEFPQFTIRQGVVVAVMPGATSEEIEAQVTRPLERYLFTYKEVNRSETTSQSKNGMVVVTVKLQDDVKNKDQVWAKIRHGLNSFKSELPQGVLAIVVNDEFGDPCALLLTIESDQRSYRELQGYSDDLADRLRRIPSVSNVKQYGEKKEQITVAVDRQRLAAYGLGQAAVMQALQSQGLSTMSGSVTGDNQNFELHVSPPLHSEDEIANQIIYSGDGKNVRVKDIATVTREYDLSESYIENNGHRCVVLSLEMIPGNNITDYGEAVDEVMQTFKNEELPDDVQIERITDQPQVVNMSIKDFVLNLLESMLVIILVMMILFPLRSAIVAAITIPLTTAVSLFVMYMLGIELNIVTLACLIVALGMVVDNSIVVIDGYLEYLRQGHGHRESAVMAVKQYFMPMTLATLCICAIFYPMMWLMTGDAVDVIGLFPITMTINLVTSLIVAVAVIPTLNAKLLRREKLYKPLKEGEQPKKGITDYVQQAYEKCLRFTFRHPYVTIITAVVLVALAGMGFSKLKLRPFPYADRNQFAVEIFLPDGKGLADTRLVADSIYNVLKRDKRTQSITTFMGQSSPRFMITYAPQLGGRNFAQFIVNTPDNQTTLDMLNEYAPKWSNAFPGAYVRFKQMDFMSEPAFEYHFYGENIDSLRAAAEQLMEHMRTMDGMEWIRTDYDTPYPIVDVNLDPVASAQLGVNRTTAQLQLMMQTGDVTAGSMWEDDYEVPVVIKDRNSEHLQLGDVQNTYLSTFTGQSVPLRQVADVKPQWTNSKIMHRNGERCLSVTAELQREVLSAPIQTALDEYCQNEIDLPDGVTYELGGELKKNNKIIKEAAESILVATIIIFFFLLFNFKRFNIAILSILAISLALPGAILGLLIANKTLSLTALLGFVTLMGIIMRNEILIFEHADGLLEQGWDVKDAAYDAGRRRMVPIFLTTATTAVGVIPMIIAGSSFWAPVGISIFAGGIGTVNMVLLVMPVTYSKLMGKTAEIMRKNKLKQQDSTPQQ